MRSARSPRSFERLFLKGIVRHSDSHFRRFASQRCLTILESMSNPDQIVPAAGAPANDAASAPETAVPMESAEAQEAAAKEKFFMEAMRPQDKSGADVK